MRQRIVTQTDLQTQARRHLPVVVEIRRRSLVDIVADRHGLRLGKVGGQAKQHTHEWITGISSGSGASLILPEDIDARGIGLQLLILGVAVIAEAELHRVAAVGN